MSKKKKILNRQLKIFYLSIFGVFLIGIVLIGFAEKYQVVGRYSRWMNAPNELAVVSLLLSISIVAKLHNWIKKHVGQGAKGNYIGAVYCIDGVIVFSLLMCFTQLGIIFNGALDTSTPANYTEVVTRKERRTNLRSITTQRIYFQDWNHPDKTITYQVATAEEYAIGVGDVVRIVTKSGALGFEWIVDLSPAETGDT